MKVVEKPWGRETWLAHTEYYASKIIEIRKGHRTSLQYHVQKHEHMYLDSGLLKVDAEDEQGQMVTHLLRAGDIIGVEAGRKHRSTALEDARIFEVSTPQLDDVVRVEDDYQR
jgi:mannose-6-phosphate isomerase-like protein (cupin superfamily)